MDESPPWHSQHPDLHIYLSLTMGLWGIFPKRALPDPVTLYLLWSSSITTLLGQKISTWLAPSALSPSPGHCQEGTLTRCNLGCFWQHITINNFSQLQSYTNTQFESVNIGLLLKAPLEHWLHTQPSQAHSSHPGMRPRPRRPAPPDTSLVSETVGSTFFSPFHY